MARVKHDEWMCALESVTPGPALRWPLRRRARAEGRPTAVVAGLLRRVARCLLISCDALLLALAPRPPRGLRNDLRTLLSRRSRHLHRPGAALRLLDSMMPGVARRFERAAFRRARLPVDHSSVAVLDFGSGDTVYALERPAGRLACKIQRASLGRSLPELVALAAHRRKGYRAVLRQYEGVQEVFPPTRFLVAGSPAFGGPAVLSVQELVPGTMRDVLRDLDDDEIRTLVRAHPRLRRHLVQFIHRTTESWERGEWIVDLGPNNLLLVDVPGEPRLVYLDVQMKRVAAVRMPPQDALYRAAIERMQRILELAGAGGEVVARAAIRGSVDSAAPASAPRPIRLGVRGERRLPRRRQPLVEGLGEVAAVPDAAPAGHVRRSATRPELDGGLASGQAVPSSAPPR